MKIYGIVVLVFAAIALVTGTISILFESAAGNNILIASGILSIIGGGMLLSTRFKKLKAS